MLAQMGEAIIQQLEAINQHLEAMHLNQPDVVSEDNSRFFSKYLSDHQVSLPLSDHNAIGPLNIAMNDEKLAISLVIDFNFRNNCMCVFYFLFCCIYRFVQFINFFFFFKLRSISR